MVWVFNCGMQVGIFRSRQEALAALRLLALLDKAGSIDLHLAQPYTFLIGQRDEGLIAVECCVRDLARFDPIRDLVSGPISSGMRVPRPAFTSAAFVTKSLTDLLCSFA